MERVILPVKQYFIQKIIPLLVYMRMLRLIMYEMKLTDRGLVFVKAQMTDWENGNDETELEIIS